MKVYRFRITDRVSGRTVATEEVRAMTEHSARLKIIANGWLTTRFDIRLDRAPRPTQ